MECSTPMPGMSRQRITVENKRIINNDRTVDCNQLVPIKYKWERAVERPQGLHARGAPRRQTRAGILRDRRIARGQ